MVCHAATKGGRHTTRTRLAERLLPRATHILNSTHTNTQKRLFHIRISACAHISGRIKNVHIFINAPVVFVFVCMLAYDVATGL